MSDVAEPHRSERVPRVLWTILLLIVGATPMIFSMQGRDVFRVPKTVFFQAGILALGAAFVSWMLVSARLPERLRHARFELALAAAVIVWTGVTTLTAVQPVVARTAIFSVFCYVILFVATIALARGHALIALLAVFVPSMVNSVIILLQAARIWSLMPFLYGRLSNYGLLGNPNVAATYLLLPSLASLVAALVFRRYRWPLAAVALLLFSGLLAAQTMTAVIAMGAALIALAFTTRSRRARQVVFVALVLGVIAFVAYKPTRRRMFEMRESIRSGNFMALTSARLPAYAASAQMFFDHPITGVGPRGFSARYMTYKLEIDEQFPQWMRLANSSFGEAHNDHLQILAETGLPGYALYLAALFVIARFSFRGVARDETEQDAFVRLFAFPAVVGFAVAQLAQFPLYHVAPTSSAIFIATLLIVWRIDARA